MPITAESKALEERKAIVWIARAVSYLVYAYLIVVELILLLGFILLLFGANPSAGFTEWAYRNLDRVMAPFRGIFSPIELGETSGQVEAVFDTSVVFAMIIYGIVALLMSLVIGWLGHRLHELRDAELERDRQAELDAQALAAQRAVDAARASQIDPLRAAGQAGVATTTAATPTTPTATPPSTPSAPHPNQPPS